MVVERAGIGIALDVEVVDVGIDLVGGDTRSYGLASEAQDLGRHRPSPAHPLDHAPGDLMRGSSHGASSPVSAYGGRPM